ncbi:FAD-binding oxidoreductase [Mesorhizobium sp. f-mel]
MIRPMATDHPSLRREASGAIELPAQLAADALIDGQSPLAERYLIDWSRDRRGSARFIVRPGSVEDVQAFVRWCSQSGVAIVVQGGNTGLAGGAIPDSSDYAVLSLERLNRIRCVDPLDFTLQADAGAVLQDVKDAAEASDMTFPLALGAQGSCTIGGNVATNAGGINVLRYGMTRDLVLGLETVLPDGTLSNGMNGLRKDNRGYSLKQLMIGSEGTLGVVTGVEVRLSPRPTQVETAYVGLGSFRQACELFRMARHLCSDLLSAFEVIGEECLPLAHLIDPKLRSPLTQPCPVHAIVELACGPGIDAGGLLETMLARALESDLIKDGVVAQSRSQAATFWAIREGLVEGQARRGFHVRTDLSVRLSQVPKLIEQARACIEREWPGWTSLTYGHAGDGNIHFNVLPPIDCDPGEARAVGQAVLTRLYELVGALGGSFSAEHGVGRSRSQVFWAGLSQRERQLHTAIKAAFDPAGLFNPACLMPGPGDV